MTRIILLSLSAILTIVSAMAKVTLGFPGEDAALVGIYVKDLRTGQVVASNESTKALVPASIMKAVTAATAMASLPTDFRFATKVYVTGTMTPEGECAGNLIIESSGDPTIDSDLFKEGRDPFSAEIAAALHKFGIKKILGRVVIKENLTDAGCIPQWEIDDVAWAYGAGLYGFNFSDNTFKIWPLKKATVPKIPDLNIEVRQARTTDLVRGINSDNLTVYGPQTSADKWMMRSAMQNPAEVYRPYLIDFLTKKGITVAGAEVGNTTTDMKLIFTHYSPALEDILREMMYESHNLFAEGMLRAIKSDSSRKAAIQEQLQMWKQRGVCTDYIKILDGSGLARADRLQPVFVGNVLEWMAKSEYSVSFVKLFPKAGVDGTVKNMLAKTPLKGSLALKSGSMNAVQCYAGYKLDREGAPTHVVVIQINSFYCDRATLRKAIEKFLVSTFK